MVSLRTKTLDQKTVGGEFIYRLPLLRESHFCVAMNRLANRLSTSPSQYGKAAASEPFPHLFQERSTAFSEKESIFMKLLIGMRDLSHEHNAKFVVLMIPFSFEVEPELLPKVLSLRGAGHAKRDYYKELGPKMQALDIPYINILEEMRIRPQEKYYPRNGEVHLNPAGHRFVAARLKEFLLARKWVPGED